MKAPGFALVLLAVLCTSASKPNQKQLMVREVAGHDDLQRGQVLSDTREIRNGAGGRVQVDLDASVFRLGANSVANVGPSGFELRDGTCLFADLSTTLTLVLDDKRYEITQGTGFVHKNGDGRKARLLIGGMTGKTLATVSGKKYAIRTGEALIINANGSVIRADFDLPRQINTCSLINDFAAPLPNLTELKKEVAHFSSMEKRGFVRANHKWQYGIDHYDLWNERSDSAAEDVRMASSPARNRPPSTLNPGGGGITLGGISFGPGGGSSGRVNDGGGDDDDDRPVGHKPGNGPGDDNHDHTAPPGHYPGKGNPHRR